MTDREFNDPGVLSLAGHRRVLDAEAEAVRLRAENERLRVRVAEMDQMIISGKVSEHSKKLCHYHPNIVVDEESPLVECADCGTALDAHAVLLQLATGERTFRQWVDRHKKERHDLVAEIERLKKQKSTLRAAVRKSGGRPLESWESKSTAAKVIDALHLAHVALGACSCPHPRHQDEHGDPTCCDGCAAVVVLRAFVAMQAGSAA